MNSTNLMDILEKSSCFTIAHDPTAKECKVCDLQQECAAKSASNKVFDPLKVLKPETEEALRNAKEKAAQNNEASADVKVKVERKKNKDEMPDLTSMDVEGLEALLSERGGFCDKFENVAVYKMRLRMAVRETYGK